MQDVERNEQSDSASGGESVASLPCPPRSRRRVEIRESSDSESEVSAVDTSASSRRSQPAPNRSGRFPGRADGGGDAGRVIREESVPAARVDAVPIDGGNNRFRHWCFTINNWEPGFEEILRRSNPAYYCCQAEIGENGTEHIQGVISFANPRAFSAVRKIIRGWHVEQMRGTIDQAVAYCTKEETRDPDHPDPWEFGQRPVCAGKAGGRSDLKAVATLVQSGGTIEAVADTYPVSVILFHRGIERLIGLRQRPRDFSTDVYWYYGPTGSGKTRAASAADPAAYWKSPSDKWWCGYEGHETVIIDDYRTDFCKFNFLLRLFDRYPMSVETKGGSRQFRAKVIYITTPKSPRETWNLRCDEDLGQLVRRIKEVRHFPAMFAGAVAAEAAGVVEVVE